MEKIHFREGQNEFLRIIDHIMEKSRLEAFSDGVFAIVAGGFCLGRITDG
jgi:hypothetical protein